MMKRLLVVAAAALCVCTASGAQDEIQSTTSNEKNAAADFANTSAAVLAPGQPVHKASSAEFGKRFENSLITSQPHVHPFLSASAAQPDTSFPASMSAAPSSGLPEPIPALPDPRFVFGGRDDFRFQLALGLSFVRFRSSRYFASAVGTSTSLTYFTNEWFAFEGNIITAFAPTINVNEHVKYAEYGAGPKIAWRRAHFEPWVHAIVGGAHVQPRTPSGGPNAVGFQTGGGLDYRLNPRFSVRLELDWISTHFWGQWQNSGQGTLQGVIHF
jgi:opacity protein-like surface antigen